MSGRRYSGQGVQDVKGGGAAELKDGTGYHGRSGTERSEGASR